MDLFDRASLALGLGLFAPLLVAVVVIQLGFAFGWWPR